MINKIFYILSLIFLTYTETHEIISSYYAEQCDNKICEYVNKVTLNIHTFSLGPQVIGYDNMTNTDIIFDLNSFYSTYGQEINDYLACVPYYSYTYNCWNEVLGTDYDLPCTNPISVGCPNYEYYSIVPFVGNDCLGKQYRYIEKLYFRNCTTAKCTRAINKELRLSGIIIYNNLTRPFDVKLEYGVLNKVSDDIKINLVSIKDTYRDFTDNVCTDAGPEYVVMNLTHHTPDHYMSRRTMSGHLVSNFIHDPTEYEFRELVLSQKGYMKNEYGTYLFIYYKYNDTCLPIEYGTQLVLSDPYISKTDGNVLFSDANCTSMLKYKDTYECQVYSSTVGVLDSEGNILCFIGDMYLAPVASDRLSSNIFDDLQLQISFSGNYAIKQVFYDRCRIKEIEYYNNTIYVYDCVDYIHIKNLYTNNVYKVRHNMTIELPDGVYSVVDYINAPSFVVKGRYDTNTMYYAEDEFYVKAMLQLGFSISTIENVKSYMAFYVISIFTLIVVSILMCLIAIKLYYKIRKHSRANKEVSQRDRTFSF